MQGIYLPTPSKLVERHFQLYDLVENKSKNGMLAAVDVAKYYNIRYETFTKLVKNRALPFAFGDSTSQRIQSYISISALWNFETQNQANMQAFWTMLTGI